MLPANIVRIIVTVRFVIILIHFQRMYYCVDLSRTDVSDVSLVAPYFCRLKNRRVDTQNAFESNRVYISRFERCRAGSQSQTIRLEWCFYGYRNTYIGVYLLLDCSVLPPKTATIRNYPVRSLDGVFLHIVFHIDYRLLNDAVLEHVMRTSLIGHRFACIRFSLPISPVQCRCPPFSGDNRKTVSKTLISIKYTANNKTVFTTKILKKPRIRLLC